MLWRDADMNALISILAAVIGFAGDEYTKGLARRKLSGREKKLCGGKVTLMLRQNGGFAMNRLESNRKLVVTVSSLVFVLLLLTYIPVLKDEGYRAVRPGLSLVLAGASGNVYDRLVRGYVTDFINVSFLKKVVFNLADVFIVVGGLLAVIGELLNE